MGAFGTYLGAIWAQQFCASLANKIGTCFLGSRWGLDHMEAILGRHAKARQLSQGEMEQVLRDTRHLIDTINRINVRTDSDDYRALDKLRDELFDAARAITGTDTPWPVHSTTGRY